MDDVARALLALLERGAAERVEHDPEWPSPCEVLPPDHHGMVNWRPVPMDRPSGFDEIPVHPSVREFYGTFWGGTAAGRHSGESVGLSAAWNAEDVARIARSVREQVAAGVPEYVAHTSSDWYFGVDNATGAVWLCEPGYPPIRQVAPSLAAFLVEVQRPAEPAAAPDPARESAPGDA
ncbi:MAG: Syd [Gemmataceae bacterium]|nr:Syd [Gemmataceae bacterium]